MGKTMMDRENAAFRNATDSESAAFDWHVNAMVKEGRSDREKKKLHQASIDRRTSDWISFLAKMTNKTVADHTQDALDKHIKENKQIIKNYLGDSEVIQ